MRPQLTNIFIINVSVHCFLNLSTSAFVREISEYEEKPSVRTVSVLSDQLSNGNVIDHRLSQIAFIAISIASTHSALEYKWWYAPLLKLVCEL